jgi:hypothetical protein
MNAGTREREWNHKDFVHSSCRFKSMTLLPSHFVISTLDKRPDSLEWLVPSLVDDLDVIHLESTEDVLIDLKIHLESRVRAGHLLRAVVSGDNQTCVSTLPLRLSETWGTHLQMKLPTRLAAFSLAVRALIIHLSTPLFGSKSQLPPPNAPTG